jgi:hypothetical protein
MWQLIKSELHYNWYHFSMISIFFLVYTALSLFDIQLLTSPEFEIDYWGGIYSIILYAFLFSIWGTRLKEKRVRYYSLLPLSQKQNSLSRFWFAALPFIFIIGYLILAQLISIDSWHNETGSLIGQLGVTLILFAGFIRGRDDWFSYWNFGKRTAAAFITVLIIQIIVVFVFLEMGDLNKGLVGLYGPEAFHYAKLIFSLLGFAILITSIFSYRKRRTYLT